MNWRLFCFLPIAAVGITGLAIAAQPASLRVQVLDQRGAPVRDAVVELDVAGGGAGQIRFPWRMAVAQKNQQFVPGTLVVAKGSTVAFPNLDQVRHSVYSFSKAAKFTIDLYGRDQSRTQGFPIAGTVALGCNIHDQMRGYIRVVDTPYAGKTDANGWITLNGIPAGSGRIVVWHPQLRAPANESTRSVSLSSGVQSQQMTVQIR